MPQITQLDNDPTPNNNDLLVTVDVGAGTTKNISREQFFTGAPLPADTVDTQAIADGAVTADKIDFTTLGVNVYGGVSSYEALTTNASDYTGYGSSYTFNLRAGQVVGITTARAGSIDAESSAIVSGSAFTNPISSQSIAAAIAAPSRVSNTSYIVADQAGTCTIRGAYKKTASGTFYARLQVIVFP